jgi:hypothetical protein
MTTYRREDFSAAHCANSREFSKASAEIRAERFAAADRPVIQQTSNGYEAGAAANGFEISDAIGSF